MPANWDSSTRDTDIVNAAAKQKSEKEGVKNENKEGESKKSECISHSMALKCVDTLLDYMGETGFEYSDIRAARKNRTAM
jgi:hypothetical protein